MIFFLILAGLAIFFFFSLLSGAWADDPIMLSATEAGKVGHGYDIMPGCDPARQLTNRHLHVFLSKYCGE